jgi:hypothetical protein
MDVVYNKVEHVRVTDVGISSVPRAALQNGIWDTVLESVPGKLRRAEVLSIASTMDLFALAREQAIETKVFLSGGDADLSGLGLDANARRFLQNDLDRGYAIVTTERVPDGAPMAGWWRINAESGETLGMTGDGYGQESVEYVLLDLIGTAKGLVEGLNSILACNSEPSMVTRLCCLMNAHADSMYGNAIGGFIGTMLGSAAGSLWSSANTISQEATGQGLLPSVGPMNCDTLPDTEW